VFDHVTLRVADLAVVSSAFTAALDELEIEQTSSTPRFSAWGNFALTQTDADHPIAHRAHLALIRPPLTSIVSREPASTPALPMTDPPARARNTPTTTTRHFSKTGRDHGRIPQQRRAG
jgi:hypothetical protein